MLKGEIMLKNRGFTLIEVMIVIGLIGVVLLVVGDILNYNFINFNQNNKYFRYKLDGRYAMSKVVNEIRKNYGTSFNAGKILASDSTVLVNSNPNDFTGNIYFYYDPDRYGTGDGYGELRGQGDRVLAKNIKDFKIESIDTGLVKITVKSGKENTKRMFEISTYLRLYD